AHERLIQCILQKLNTPITKNSRAVGRDARKLKSQRGRRLPFDKEARMLRTEIDLPPVSQIGDRRCPECRSSMRLAWIEPDKKPGYDKRTFECLHCQHLDAVTVKLR
ncbi:MAG: hypothetical protein WB685_02375, partial [Pseudolabrys sp.]